MRYFPWQKASIGLAAALCLPQATAHSQALLKPLGAASQDLQPRAIDVQAHIDGAWAQTSVTTVYANANTAPIEADFLYAAPPGAVITGFAYWYGREKVTAQVTEKERAKAIFAFAKNAGGDPGLVEMQGKNLFRARIAKVLPKFNLRVEIKYAQPLGNLKGVPSWSYPLLGDTRDVTLDWLRVRATVQNAPDATNNFDARLEKGAFEWRKYNFKPGFDPRITLAASKAPLRAHLVTQHRSAGADDAYFALSLRGKGDKSLPQIEGVETFDLLPPQRAGNGEIRLFGRYRGKGAASVKWGGIKTTVWFPPAGNAVSEVAGLAAPLWGANKIAAISGRSDAREEVIALSTRFDVPSKWTSWIAMPSEQRLAMREELRRLDMTRRAEKLGRVFAIELENGRPFSSVALRARGDLRALQRSGIGRRASFDEEKARAAAMEARLGELGRDAMAARMGIVKNDADARMTRLAAVAEADKSPYLQRAQKGLREIQVKSVAAKWTAEVVALREQTSVAKRLKTQLETLQERYDNDEDFQNAAYQKTAEQMALSTLNEALAGRENGLKAALFIDAGERYARKCGQMSFGKDFYAPTIQTNLNAANERIVHEIEAGRDISADARDAQTRVRQLEALSPELRGNWRVQGSKEYEIDRARRGLAHETAFRLAQTLAEHPGDRAEAAALRAQLDRMADKTEANAEEILGEETKRYKTGERLLNARQFQKQLERASDDPLPLPEPTALPATPTATPDPNEDYSDPAPAQSYSPPSSYQVRPGDPLISLDAPRDAQQVIAVLPDGTLKKLEWNDLTAQWETRFDVPGYANDGAYIVQILLVRADGTRSRFQMRFDVDTAAPRAHAAKFGQSQRWQLQITTEDGATRVSALLPWGERIALSRQSKGLWRQFASVPAKWRGQKAQVRFVVTDSAHNRTEIAVDWN